MLALTAVAAAFGLLGPISQVFPIDDAVEDRRRPDRDGRRRRLRALLRHPLARGAPARAAVARGARAHRAHVGPDGRRLGHDGRDRDGGHVRRSARTSSTASRAATIAVVACAVIGSVTVLPAVLELLGAADRPRPDPVAAAPAHRDAADSRFWPAVIDRVLRRPGALVSRSRPAVLVALALPALSLQRREAERRALASQNEPALRDARATSGATFPSTVRAGDRRRHRPAGRSGRAAATRSSGSSARRGARDRRIRRSPHERAPTGPGGARSSSRSPAPATTTRAGTRSRSSATSSCRDARPHPGRRDRGHRATPPRTSTSRTR